MPSGHSLWEELYVDNLNFFTVLVILHIRKSQDEPHYCYCFGAVKSYLHVFLLIFVIEL